MNSKINRNDSCPCGSGRKYKACCLKRDASPTEHKPSINEILSFLKTGFENINLVEKNLENINVKKIDLLNNRTLECQYYSKTTNSIDVKVEIGTMMGFLYGFFKDDSFEEIKLNYFAIRAFDDNDKEILYAISSVETAKLIGEGNSIAWIKNTIFQENTKDYRLSVAKRQISEIENSLRTIIVDRLSKKHGENWFVKALADKIRNSIIDTYKNQFDIEIEDGAILINYTYVLQLKKIMCANWKDFADLFKNKNMFEDSLVDFNKIRREEAHNRDISETDLCRLKEIYEYLLINVTKKYPEILPLYLIENWKIQIKEIMLEGYDYSFTDDEIINETNDQLKLMKSVTNTKEFIANLKNKERRLKSIVIPVQKLDLHDELLEVISRFRELYETLLKSVNNGKLSDVEATQKEIDLHKAKMDEFADKYILSES